MLETPISMSSVLAVAGHEQVDTNLGEKKHSECHNVERNRLIIILTKIFQAHRVWIRLFLVRGRYS